jgi:RimJ/RimL family protein N-acetyltransferase
MTEADAPLVFRLNSDPEVVRYVHEPLLENEEQALAIIRDIILPQYKSGLGRWAAHQSDSGEFIGWCGLKYIAGTGIIDLGYRFMKPFWGKGFATEAARYSLDYGFQNLHLHTVYGSAHLENLASLRVLEKAGMTFFKKEILGGVSVKTYRITSDGS